MATENETLNGYWINNHIKREFLLDLNDAPYYVEAGTGATDDIADKGLRCPINDTDSNGYDFKLLATDADSEWKDGSINKAVIETYKINGGTFAGGDATKAAAGNFSLLEVREFSKMPMQYGYSEDARNRKAGDGMSFRAYPTPVIKEVEINKISKDVSEQLIVGIDGRIISTPSDSLPYHVRAGVSLVLNYPLPYDFIYTMEVAWKDVGGALTAWESNKFLIKAGDTRTTHYLKVDGSTETWLIVNYTRGAIFNRAVSTYSGGVHTFNTSNQEMQVRFPSGALEQEPVYNRPLIVPDASQKVLFLAAEFSEINTPLNDQNSTGWLKGFKIIGTVCDEQNDLDVYSITPKNSPLVLWITKDHGGGTLTTGLVPYSGEHSQAIIWEDGTYYRVWNTDHDTPPTDPSPLPSAGYSVIQDKIVVSGGYITELETAIYLSC